MFLVLRTRTYEATVSSVRWEQTIVVERYQVRDREGWRQDLDREAFDVRSLGSRVHHYDQVFDGYDVESYTVSVPCGQDCVDVPEVCSESCSPNGNGFATCRTICSGGGRSCVTRYCDEWRTRDVPRYRPEPRYADWVSYKIWAWGYARTLTASGASVSDVHWPQSDVVDDDPSGEREREVRRGDYEVTLSYGDEIIVVDVAAESFPSFDVGTTHVLERGWGSVRLDGVEVQEAS